MADIFQEVDEEVRRDRLQKLWDRYSIYLIAVCVLIVAGIAAWRGYEYWQNKKIVAAGAAFEAALSLSEAGKHAEAEAAFAKIVTQAPSGYHTLARLQAAGELAEVKPAEGVKAYDELAADGSLSPTLRDLAALRAAMLLVDKAPLSEMTRRLSPLAEPGRTFRHVARELLALAAWHNNDVTTARRYIDMIATDAESPAGTRQRADVLSALIAASGKS